LANAAMRSTSETLTAWVAAMRMPGCFGQNAATVEMGHLLAVQKQEAEVANGGVAACWCDFFYKTCGSYA
jgi:hypothetical protein